MSSDSLPCPPTQAVCIRRAVAGQVVSVALHVAIAAVLWASTPSASASDSGRVAEPEATVLRLALPQAATEDETKEPSRANEPFTVDAEDRAELVQFRMWDRLEDVADASAPKPFTEQVKELERQHKVVPIKATTLPQDPSWLDPPRKYEPALGVRADGPHDKTSIQRVVRQSFGRFRACYAQGLRKDARLEGRLDVTFKILRDGAVYAVSTGGTLRNDEVAQCVARQFYGLQFPPHEGKPIRVTYPITFSPGG